MKGVANVSTLQQENQFTFKDKQLSLQMFLPYSSYVSIDKFMNQQIILTETREKKENKARKKSRQK